VEGSDGWGDPYYPTQGNGGYQVDAYDIAFSYDPDSGEFSGTATITGSVTSADRLGRFDLDLQPGMDVSRVTVDGEVAAVDRDDAELVITPATGLEPGAPLTVVVEYDGEPTVVALGTGGLGGGGWHRTESGGALAAGQPFSASAWYPVNEHPADTATFAITADVPSGWEVFGNGLPVTDGLPVAGPGRAVFRWAVAEPIASYLTTVYIDRFTTTTGTLADGTPILNAFAPDQQSAQSVAARTPEVLDYLATKFGPYPFESAGGIYSGVDLGFALETATRPVYPADPELDLIVHELAHQWYGDTVTIATWSDICLNECLASYAPWLYAQDVQGADLDAFWRQQMTAVQDDPTFWSVPLVDMGAGNEFTSVYERGPLALHALRREIGEDPFARLLTEWVTRYAGKTATFDDFAAMITEVAGRDMAAFVDAWFRRPVVPDPAYRTPGSLGG
jgi:aminopeptidase N